LPELIVSINNIIFEQYINVGSDNGGRNFS